MEKLKTKYTSKDDVPDQYADLYEEKGGAWILTGIEGANDADALARLGKQRDQERTKRQEAEAKLKKFESLGDAEPDDLLALQDEVESLKAQLASGGKGKDENAAKLAEATTALKKLEREHTKLKEEAGTYKTRADELDGKIRQSTIEAALTKAGTSAKLRPEALSDLGLFGRMFEVAEDGKVITKDGVGVTPGIEADVWLSDMRSSRPHWWPESTGGNARSGNGGGAPSDNPFDKKAPNATKAGELMGKDPAKAEQYARAAGYADVNDAVKGIAKALSGNNGART